MTKYKEDNFCETYVIGMKVENRFNDYLAYKKREVLERSSGYQPKHDFRFIDKNGIRTSAEVKTCTRVSNDVPIEYESRGKASGIVSTEGFYFVVYCIEDQAFYVAKSGELMEWLDSNPRSYISVKNTSNSSETKLYLIDKYTWRDTFSVVDLTHVAMLEREDL
ncbi:hypothetical protein [Deinococcus sp. QL22]|uniref:hypothetical protein n=1 Tax=Deinococcus sp. QL22 TaxID=2939437 RepID=UPI0020173BC6|nr:hypothetical protein [Deinococcus sp. QL22]UQN05349.1 hypothetical protein M1R55_10705 [Deinococcus sp. QL22]